MGIQSDIESKLTEGLKPLYLQVVNESSNHNVPVGSVSHFKVVVVSNDFAGLMLIKRHRRVNELLADELKNKIHALAIHAYTEEEWHEMNGNAPKSPPCLGGGKIE